MLINITMRLRAIKDDYETFRNVAIRGTPGWTQEKVLKMSLNHLKGVALIIQQAVENESKTDEK